MQWGMVVDQPTVNTVVPVLTSTGWRKVWAPAPSQKPGQARVERLAAPREMGGIADAVVFRTNPFHQSLRRKNGTLSI